MTTTSAASTAASSWRDRAPAQVTYDPDLVRRFTPIVDTFVPFIEPATPPLPPPPRVSRPTSVVTGWVLIGLGVAWAAMVAVGYMTFMAKLTPSFAVAVIAWAVNAVPGFLMIAGGAVAVRVGKKGAGKLLAQHADHVNHVMAEHTARTAAARARHEQWMSARAAQVAEYNADGPRWDGTDNPDPISVELSRQQVHGEPGRGLSVGRFGAAALAGKAGEEATVAALAPLLVAYPAARVVNGLEWPGTDHADVDHVVLVGNRLAVIDSKQWRAGNYWWDGSTMYRDGEKVEHPLKVAAAATALAGKLRGPLEVRTWVVLHCDAPITVENAPPAKAAPANAPRLVTAEQLVDELGAWFADATGTDTVDRHALAALRSLMRS